MFGETHLKRIDTRDKKKSSKAFKTMYKYNTVEIIRFWSLSLISTTSSKVKT